jgi:septum site-determining protein MinD
VAEIVSIHSFRGGTGKSNLTANLAVGVAQEGNRVGIVDTDIQSPGIHVIFGLDEGRIEHSLNDYLWERCRIEDAAYDVSAALTPTADEAALPPGSVHLIPSSLKAGEIARILREGYDVGVLSDGFRQLAGVLNLDYLFIDTHPGLNEETLLSMTISNTLVLVLRPDRQDYQGTGVTVEVARKLDIPRLLLVLNKVPEGFDHEEVARQVSSAYEAAVAGILPHSDDLMRLASGGVFRLRYPDHPLTADLSALTAVLSG